MKRTHASKLLNIAELPNLKSDTRMHSFQLEHINVTIRKKEKKNYEGSNSKFLILRQQSHLRLEPETRPKKCPQNPH